MAGVFTELYKLGLRITGEDALNESIPTGEFAEPTLLPRGGGARAVTTPVSTKLTGRYRLETLLRDTAHSATYRALDTETWSLVAVTLLHLDHLRTGKEFGSTLKGLQADLKAATQLHHPNIMQTLSFESEQERHFVVREYFRGEHLQDLAQRRSDGRLDVYEVVHYGLHILNALQHAHAQGIFHDNINPNAAIVRGEELKLSGFGVSRLAERCCTLRVGGDPAYLSPERLEGRPCDERSDLYSVAATLYALGNGVAPFGYASDAVAHSRVVVPGSPHLPKALHQVLAKALARHPGDRFVSATQMVQALQAVADQRPHDLVVERPALDDARSGPLSGIFVVGRFFVGGQIARFSDGTEYYIAFDQRLGQEVSVEVGPADEPAHSSPTLIHPNIAHVHPVGTHVGRAIGVCARLRGESLVAQLGTGELSLQNILGLGIDLLDALDYAHSLGAVHGCIDPASIFVDNEHRAHLIRFGREPTSSLYQSTAQFSTGPSVLGDLYAVGAVLTDLLGEPNPNGGAMREQVAQVLQRALSGRFADATAMRLELLKIAQVETHLTRSVIPAMPPMMIDED